MAQFLHRSIGAALCMAGVSLPVCPAVAQTKDRAIVADTIIEGGKVYLSGDWAQALAIKDGVIVATGGLAEIEAYRGAETNIVELAGATVFPGLHDMHVHPMNAGLQELQCRIRQGAALVQLTAAVARCAASKPAGEWISGGQWDANSLGGTFSRLDLDRAAPDNPVELGDLSGHSLWVNSRALELAGITDETPDPAGGVIERDKNGKATGVLRESAMTLVRKLVPPTTSEQNVGALHWALERMVSFGITSLTDAAVSVQGLEAYASLADRGQLKQRVRGCVVHRPYQDATSGRMMMPIDRANLYARDRFVPDCVKISLDGVPTEGHTAVMVDPYVDSSSADPARSRGLLQVPPEELNRILVDLDARGITVKMHAAGDGAVRAAIAGIAAARAKNGFSGPHHDVAHNSFAKPDDIAKARSVGATLEFSPYIWYPNQITPDIARATGAERMKRWVPVKEALDAGVLVVGGSDWAVQPLVDPESTQAVVPELNPWVGIEGLVTRRAPGGVGQPLGEPITLEDAIDIFTVNSARQMGNGSRTGRLATGMLADLIVLDRNPFEISPTEIHKTRVQMTMINGEIVYRREP